MHLKSKLGKNFRVPHCSVGNLTWISLSTNHPAARACWATTASWRSRRPGPACRRTPCTSWSARTRFAPEKGQECATGCQTTINLNVIQSDKQRILLCCICIPPDMYHLNDLRERELMCTERERVCVLFIHRSATMLFPGEPRMLSHHFTAVSLPHTVGFSCIRIWDQKSYWNQANHREK